MATLHIRHPITDRTTWTAVFNAFGEKRREAGVLADTVRHPVGDDLTPVDVSAMSQLG